MEINLAIDKQSKVPYYHQLKQAILNTIDLGGLKPGDMLPGEFALAEHLGISRLVVHRALRELVTDGVLERKRAVGTFVAMPVKREFMVEGSLFSLSEGLAKSELDYSNRILTQEVIPGVGEVLQALKLNEDSQVVHLISLRYIREFPFAMEEMFFPYTRFPAMATHDLNNASTYKTLKKIYDAYPCEAVDRVSADGATRFEASLLDIRINHPVLKLKRVAFDKSGEPVEYALVTFHADRYQIVSRVRKTEN
ncbi:MAG: GntR family transcriptional regulator [Anaerolineales bacterium]|nr:GntR family transcriptional regulator [Anaerolineales bacterium]